VTFKKETESPDNLVTSDQQVMFTVGVITSWVTQKVWIPSISAPHWLDSIREEDTTGLYSNYIIPTAGIAREAIKL